MDCGFAQQQAAQSVGNGPGAAELPGPDLEPDRVRPECDQRHDARHRRCHHAGHQHLGEQNAFLVDLNQLVPHDS